MNSSKEQRVHEVFENISGKYDYMNSVISFNRHVSWRKHTMKLMNVRKDCKALDVCCGTADWAILLSEAVGANGTVYGLDFSENMLEVGQKKVDQLNYNNIKLVHGNAMELPFKDNEFDYVTIGFGLRNVPDYFQVLSEMQRVVKPGGMVVCLETSQPTTPGFRQAYYFYFNYIMPLLGKWLAKSYQEYSWLQESAQDFPGSEELSDLFRKAGLDNIKVKKYSGGVAATHIGYKPEKMV